MASALLGASAVASASAVTDWNEIAASAVAAGRPGPIGQMDLALVQVAVHDAIQAIVHGNSYVNIHTTQNPGGEIRGQLRR